MRVTISGSMSAAASMAAAKTQLESMGHEVESPDVTPAGGKLDARSQQALIDQHFRKIDRSDVLLVCNDKKHDIDNYVGGSTLMEMTYAYAQGLEIFLLHPIPDMQYADEIAAMHPIVLGGKVEALDAYVQSLPALHISSTSPVKHTALRRALRRAGISTRPVGYKVASGVNEQPMSIEETYEGAINRHARLKKVAVVKTGDYFATVESGLHAVHPDHNVFGCTAIVVERSDGVQKIGIDLDIEYPKEMTDLVPSQYPDIGVLVQQKYGATLKDPVPYFTNQRLNRTMLMESAAYSVAVQLGGKYED